MAKTYFEFIDAHDAELARNCKCEIGQTVARLYVPGESVLEFIGTRQEAEQFIADRTK